jgi:hypothetical protein
MTNGEGCYNSGYLNLTNIQYEGDSLYNSISERLNSLNFWDLKNNDTSCPKMLDGQFWTIEAIDSGRYNFIIRQSPYNCRSEQIKNLVKIIDELQIITHFEEYWKLKNRLRKETTSSN